MQKHAISTQARRRVIEHCQTATALAVRDRAASYRQPVRENLSLPVPFLPILEGFACRHCPYHDSWCSTNRKAVQEHINQVHKLQPAKLQIWCSSTRAQYWEVATTTPAATSTTSLGRPPCLPCSPSTIKGGFPALGPRVRDHTC